MHSFWLAILFSQFSPSTKCCVTRNTSTQQHFCAVSLPKSLGMLAELPCTKIRSITVPSSTKLVSDVVDPLPLRKAWTWLLNTVFLFTQFTEGTNSIDSHPHNWRCFSKCIYIFHSRTSVSLFYSRRQDIEEKMPGRRLILCFLE